MKLKRAPIAGYVPPDGQALFASTVGALRDGLVPHGIDVFTRNEDGEQPYLLIQAKGDAAEIVYGILLAHGVIKQPEPDIKA